MFDEFIEKLKSEVIFKEETEIGDSVLVLVQGNEMVPNTIQQGVVTEISLDKNPGWWVVTIIFLFPPNRVRWMLREAYFTGQSAFTMNGTAMWIAAIQDLKDVDKEEVKKPKKKLRPFTLLKGGKDEGKSETKDS